MKWTKILFMLTALLLITAVNIQDLLLTTSGNTVNSATVVEFVLPAFAKDVQCCASCPEGSPYGMVCCIGLVNCVAGGGVAVCDGENTYCECDGEDEFCT